jgi:hypothetical protein
MIANLVNISLPGHHDADPQLLAQFVHQGNYTVSSFNLPVPLILFSYE